jgi:acyl-CoA thioesterase FadM
MKTRISYYDLDCRGHLKFSALLRMVHIAADENASTLDIGFAQMAPLGISFVLQRFSAVVVGGRLPLYGEEVDINTWPAAIERGLFIRKGDMRGKDGTKLMEWASLWLLFDLNARKILKPSALPIDGALLLQGDMGVAVAPAKVEIPSDFAACGVVHSSHTHTVHFADVDTNMHMNNAVYGDVISNAAFSLEGVGVDPSRHAPTMQADPGRHAPWSRLDINYLAEAKPGDEIVVTARCVGSDVPSEILILGENVSGEQVRRGFAARVVG